MRHRRQVHRRGRGAVLIEALVAFTLLATGMMSLVRWQLQLRGDAELAAVRSEAVRLAETDVETLRTLARTVADGAALRAAIAGDGGEIASADGARRFELTRTVETGAASDATPVVVDVGWTDRSGRRQHVRLYTVVAAGDAGWTGARTLPVAAERIASPSGAPRAASIPVGAVDLRDGRSAWKPTATSPVVFLFDNASGALVGRCEPIDATIATAAPDLASLRACDRLDGQLLAGVVRFSSAAPPSLDDADDPPLGFEVRLTLRGGGYPAPPSCGVQAMKTVAFESRGGERTAAVPDTASPSDLGVAAWTETGERYARYACAVFPRADGRWSGHVDLVPSGWTIGARAGDRRVCRRVADLDRSGAIDANREHPADYSAVDGTLRHQNYLVVRGDQGCPTGGSAPHQPAS